MIRRLLGSLGMATGLAMLLGPASHAQSPIKTVPGVTPGTGAKGYVQPKTPDGQPDLTGFWTNSTYVPLERPKNVTKEFYTLEEVAKMEKEAAAREDEQTVPGTASDVHYDGTQFGLGRSQGTYARNLRTSLITDPPDGRIPPLSADGQKRLADRNEARKRRNINLFSVEHPNGRYDAAENNSLDDRCIVTGHSGPPMASAGYNGTYQIIQSPGHVMILVENNHVARMIPVDGRPALPQNVRSWTGVSRGRWDGNTLVVETSNFNTDLSTPGSGQPAFWYAMSANMKVTEWFTRVDTNTINYKFTVEDPSTWTRPWSAEMPFLATVGPIFEHACHEGNRDMGNILTAARVLEKKAATEAAAKKGSN
jgi:hypothetical protein